MSATYKFLSIKDMDMKPCLSVQILTKLLTYKTCILHLQDKRHYMTIATILFYSQHILILILGFEHSIVIVSTSVNLCPIMWQTSEIRITSEQRTKDPFPKCLLFGGSTVYKTIVRIMTNDHNASVVIKIFINNTHRLQ